MREAELIFGDAADVLAHLPASSVDAVVTDPPYPEIDRDYGRLSESEWHDLMARVVAGIRRVLTPRGSAVFVLQANQEYVGRTRPWLWEFMARHAREWNMVQDAWWWNFAAVPTVHCHRTKGLMRPSLKACVWLGPPDCWRDQDAVLWEISDAQRAVKLEDRALRRPPSGMTYRKGRVRETAEARGGATPFNVLPFANTNSVSSGGAKGHGAATPLPLCEWWVKYICPPGGVVLDPFAGSCTVGIAALRLGRNFIGIEKHEPFIHVGLGRLEAVEAAIGLKPAAQEPG